MERGWPDPLGSVAPNNKRGEDEQHGLRRTVEPFALGLYGQLAAALASISSRRWAASSAAFDQEPVDLLLPAR